MRVALVIQKLAGLRGGVERVVTELAVELRARGHSVTLVTYEPATGPPGYDIGELRLLNLFPPSLRRVLGGSDFRRSPTPGEATERGLSTHGNVWPLTHVKWQATHGVFARRLRRWLVDHPADAVVGFLPPAISAVAVAGVALGRERPRLVASTHNVPVEDFGDSPRWDQNPVARRTNLWALEVVDAVTVLQPEFVAQLPRRAQAHAIVLSNPVARLASPSPQEREPLIVGVGRLTEVKRYDILIRAFALVADEFPRWRLEIHGDGPERDRLVRLVDQAAMGKRVRVSGATAQIAEVYDRARIICHPALFEGFGLAVAEGIVHGAFVLASRDCPGVNGLVEHERTGLLVDERDDPVAAFAGGLRQLIDRPPAEEQRRAAAEALLARLDPQRIYDEWERVLSGA